MQPRGNVFYDVAPRTGKKLRVETPYLVAVIKGTQFNVAAHEDSATVSLFEGLLEVWTPDASDVVQLHAGEIATRGRGERGIRVLSMATGETLRAATHPTPDGLWAVDPGLSAWQTGELDTVGAHPLAAPVDLGGGLIGDTSSSLLETDLTEAKIGLAADPDAATVEADLAAAVDLGAASVAATLDTAADLGAGAVSTDVGLDASLAGAVDAAADASAAVDLGGGSLDAALDAGVTVGPLDVDLGADLGADLAAPDPASETEPSIVEELVQPLRGLLR